LSLKPPDDRLSSHNLILGGWIALIFFSSTDIAASWANALYAVLSTGSGLDKGVSMFVFQKAYHVFLFGVLGCLIASANGSRRNPLPRVMLWSFLIGALSEALQFAFESFCGGRPPQRRQRVGRGMALDPLVSRQQESRIVCRRILTRASRRLTGVSRPPGVSRIVREPVPMA